MNRCIVGSRLSSVIGIASLALLLGGTRSLAQEATTGTIEGQVVDAQGLAIPGATVIVTGAQGAKTFVTDANGNFLAPFLTPGVHALRVELQGFRPATIERVNVALGQRVTLTPSRCGSAA